MRLRSTGPAQPCRALVTGSVQARTAATPAAPQGLRAFLLRPTETVTHEFAHAVLLLAPRARNDPLRFELSKNPSFTEAGTFWWTRS